MDFCPHSQMYIGKQAKAVAPSVIKLMTPFVEKGLSKYSLKD